MFTTALLLTVCSYTSNECYDIVPMTWSASSEEEYRGDIKACISQSKSILVSDGEYIVESSCESYS